MMKKFKILLLALVLIIAASMPTIALADEQNETAYDLMPVYGISPLSESSTLTVKEAYYTFDITQFPEKTDSLADLKSTASTKYVLSNPGTADVTETLALTLPLAPEYGTDAFPEGSVSIFVDGIAVEATLTPLQTKTRYSFTVTVPAGGTAEAKASFPVYPCIVESYTPLVYGFSFSVSEMKEWSSFGKLSFKVNTPYHVIGSSIYGFSIKNGVGELTFNQIPNEDFSFYLCVDAKPKNPDATKSIVILIVLMLLITFGPIALTFLIIVLVNKAQKKKQKQRYENRYNLYNKK